MNEIRIKRNERDDLVFRGERLVRLDDREWMGIAPNWWELILYRTEVGRYVLASVFHRNYPRGKTLYGALIFERPEDMRDYIIHDCNGPSMIADALLNRARRRLRDLDNPLPPLPVFARHGDYDDEPEYPVRGMYAPVTDFSAFGEREVPMA